MPDLHTILVTGTGWTLQLVGLFWIVAAAYFALRLPGPPGRKVRHFARTFLPEPWLLVAVPMFVVALRLSPQRLWADLRFTSTPLALAGAACVVASALWMCWARWSIGTMWAGRPLVQEGHDLHTTGPYAIVRHPIYTGLIGLALGATLADGFGQLIAVLVGTVAFVGWRVRAEERMMTATFGDRYRSYRRRVPALVPVPRGAG